jgi:hypothetical protein
MNPPKSARPELSLSDVPRTSVHPELVEGREPHPQPIPSVGEVRPEHIRKQEELDVAREWLRHLTPAGSARGAWREAVRRCRVDREQAAKDDQLDDFERSRHRARKSVN